MRSVLLITGTGLLDDCSRTGRMGRIRPSRWTSSKVNFRWRRMGSDRGTTLIELIAAVTILLILMGAAVPLARYTVKRQRETELRRDLWEMRAAIDRYKDAADKNAFRIAVDSHGYPKDLDTLVKGEDVQGKKLKFLRRVPVDPMTGTTDWGLRSDQDDPTSDSWGSQNVFDVYTKSDGTALDGTKYKDW